MKISIVFSLFLFGLCWCNEKDFRAIDSIRDEEPCVSQGGMCTFAADCPHGQLAEKQGCPKQRHLGVECCFGISVKETRCERHGGVCIKGSPACDPDLVFRGATDCLKDHKCCIMVD